MFILAASFQAYDRSLNSSRSCRLNIFHSGFCALHQRLPAYPYSAAKEQLFHTVAWGNQPGDFSPFDMAETLTYTLM
ncbi:MAG: hypothetical protein CMQ19_07970 [Gammaproteobacteria bacterium]|nr:hypothetical protein [Gammaproteobacteria bacterium]